MSLTSIIGAASSALQSAAEPLLDAARETVAPAVASGLDQVAGHPQWFGQEAAGVAGFLAALCRSEPTGSPVLLPRPLQDTVQTALSRGLAADASAGGDAATKLQEIGSAAVGVSSAVAATAVAVPACAFTFAGGAGVAAATVGAAAAIAAGTVAVAGTAAAAGAAASAGAVALAGAAQAARSIDGALAELGVLAELVAGESTPRLPPLHHGAAPTLPQPWADLVSFAASR